MAEPNLPLPNPDLDAEWKRKKNLENLARARAILALKKEKQRTEELLDAQKLIEKTDGSKEPEPFIIESNKASEEPEQKRFFWAEPKFRSFQKRRREPIEAPPIEPMVDPVTPSTPLLAEEPPLKKQKIEETYWEQTKNTLSNHASSAAKVFVASFFVLLAQTLAKQAHSQV